MRYADRILFGTDHAPDVDAYRLYYRFLETDDEYFNYGLGPIPSQGRWTSMACICPMKHWQKSMRAMRGGF